MLVKKALRILFRLIQPSLKSRNIFMPSFSCSTKPTNFLLAALPDEVYQRLCVHLEIVKLPQHQVLYHAGDRFRYAYFPSNAIISSVAIMENGSIAEIGVIGNEGMVGLPIFLKTDYIVNSSLVVQIGGSGYRIAAEELLEESACYEVLQDLLKRYIQARIIQISQTAACNSYHKIEQRFARWLLMVRNRLQTDEIRLTQEFIAQMLGVQRSGVSEIAARFQREGIIQYRRGLIRIISLKKLKNYSCECYELVENEFDRILKIDR